MAIGLVGRKRGMSRVFDENGVSVPVTVVEVEPNRVVQMKDSDSDGYRAIQVTTGERRASRVTKAAAGHFKKAGVEAGRGLWEFRVEGEWPTVPVAAPQPTEEGEEPAEAEQVELAVGGELTVSLFSEGQIVDVVGRSIGKGYGGVIKRHNFRSQRMTHGNSKAHRAPGSIGQNQSPGHVFKGKKMSGQLGNARTTVQNLRVVRVDAERNLILIQGGVPGAKGGDVVISPAVKKAG
ncbi:50S ribosomal protein L3 [Salinisphaera shabanensis E1L3A]|uniref:Large ribosomal subunit protein uL3 n=1 Tax=Salinisphaera shabanensis E1L3A TaxID=1033802 RepID=U2EI79_9GAMM|nr:50S ribosomal protein L3 [Salinisphaera shabanensis]ERJ18047.1 50S ribosomal protein L3 [Salinisphaera shabanensis E1L3A]